MDLDTIFFIFYRTVDYKFETCIETNQFVNINVFLYNEA